MDDRSRCRPYNFSVLLSVFVWSTLLIISAGCSSVRQASKQPFVEPLQISPQAVNINTASKEELQRLPYVGAVVAGRIIEFRTTHGKFRRPENLMFIKGISDARFRRIRHLVRTE